MMHSIPRAEIYHDNLRRKRADPRAKPDTEREPRAADGTKRTATDEVRLQANQGRPHEHTGSKHHPTPAEPPTDANTPETSRGTKDSRKQKGRDL